jgi:hypothetical protein
MDEMLNKEQAQRRFDEDPNFVRQLALTYIEIGKINVVEAKLGIKPNALVDLFYEQPKYERAFDMALQNEANNKIMREGYVNVFKISRRLLEVISDDNSPEDMGPTIKDVVSAANTLTRFYEQILRPKNSAKASALDHIWDEVNDEPTTTKGASDM